MSTRTLFILAVIGILSGVISIIIYNEKPKNQPPIAVNYNPYTNGVYANGIVESEQENGSNINIYPEVSGTVIKIFAKNGQKIKKGDSLLFIENSVQQGIVEKDKAQIQFAQENLTNLKKQWEKLKKSHELDSKSVSKNALDSAEYAFKMAIQSLNVAQAQFHSDQSLLDKYIIHAPVDGIVLRMTAAIGDYISPQGVYDSNTQTNLPVTEIGVTQDFLHVRAYLDEILIPKLPSGDKLESTLFIRGLNDKGIPLTFVSIQPSAIPNIQLSDERNIRVDIRVLPIVFKFKKPSDLNIYPGQLVDVYIKGKK